MFALQSPLPTNSGGGAAGDTSLVRTYRAWKGNNEFCLRGRLIFGPDGKSILFTVFLILAPVAVFSAFVARKLLDYFPHHWGYSILIAVILHTIFVSLYFVL
ncbi:unnamed protein product [Sphenostylis stenocarpa]|uniref:Uncharacterized protein n=1 Tax=Sphenostylis stenocarpa TaxID=92480 RepID=A0AA86TIR0_9FABA|nr:unnamed protein product [Sphenostylis stenocarpa]